MALHANIPDDVLYITFSYLEHDLQSLCFLAKVCRRFNQITRKMIFGHIGVASVEKQPLLLRSLDEDPELRSSVHSCAPGRIDREGTIKNDSLQKALGFPNLRTLTLVKEHETKNFVEALKYHSRRGKSDEDFHCHFLDSHSFLGLRSIQLGQRGLCNFTTTEILRLILVPGVKEMVADCLDDLKEPRLPGPFRTMKSTLTSLDLRGRTHYIAEHPIILPFASSSSLPNSDGHITRGRWIFTLPYDGSSMDLSDFPVLEELHITSCCLLPLGKPSAERDELYKLLPARLRRLRLDFPRESGIFYYHLKGEPIRNNDINAVPHSRHSWILQFPMHKPKSFPNLTNVAMVDPPGNIGYWLWRKAPWAPPEQVATTF
ncbi:hypothetical protein K505DRAFT_361379 [Melanomma pulvis-pyrius CBS 109.77]|uniref:F-box domain-containing protein n=1 Tax=Melanomma pulvis-pyrius CBS 109.77 TaxID=1314802 RepID=A0A6A6XCE0_9PLEO|nr:hypothetical protein K505DRAFT_361379 [Melanomma pulvis-pyrius CBS 109.77]